jgi:HK97 gp10 family phage protein
MPSEFNNFDKLREKLKAARTQIVTRTAFDIQARAQLAAAVDTGFMRSSVYVATAKSSSYGARLVSDPSKQGDLLPPVARPMTDTEAIVAVGAAYAIYVEYGTSRMAAQPFLIPAAEAVRPVFTAAMAAIERRLQS